MSRSKNSYFTSNQGGLVEPKTIGPAESDTEKSDGDFIIMGWGEEFLNNCPAPVKKQIDKSEVAKEKL